MMRTSIYLDKDDDGARWFSWKLTGSRARGVWWYSLALPFGRALVVRRVDPESLRKWFEGQSRLASEIVQALGVDGVSVVANRVLNEAIDSAFEELAGSKLQAGSDQCTRH